MTKLEEIQKYFNCKLKEFPIEGYHKIEKWTERGDSKNEIWNVYYYELMDFEFGIFDKLRVIGPNDQHMNFLFSTDKFDVSIARKIVNIFWKVFGKDEFGKGEFDLDDLAQINQDNFWSGRLWDLKTLFIMIDHASEGDLFEISIKW